jgi:uncharacterized protein YjbJ (UPF0337 family)
MRAANGTLPAIWSGSAGVSPAELGRTRDMDKDRIEGTVKEGAGKVQEEWGRATDNPQTEAEGDERQIEGKVQKGWGEAKDSVRDVADKVDDDLKDDDA